VHQAVCLVWGVLLIRPNRRRGGFPDSFYFRVSRREKIEIALRTIARAQIQNLADYFRRKPFAPNSICFGAPTTGTAPIFTDPAKLHARTVYSGWAGSSIVTQFRIARYTNRRESAGGLYNPRSTRYRAFSNPSLERSYMLRHFSRKSLVLLMLLLSHFLLVAQAKTLLVDDSDDSSHLCLYVGDVVTIKLASNPSTGYSWGHPEGIAHLQLLSAQPEQGSASRVGAPGFQIFSFKATDAGESTLTLNYSQPFEKNTPAVKTFLVTLTIEPRPFIANNSSAKP
jgi:predicted secreted protein